jgi:formylmethanofuran dehydrogenase subunit E
MMTNETCSMCDELLTKKEERYFNVSVNEIPLCTICILKDWELI